MIDEEVPLSQFEAPTREIDELLQLATRIEDTHEQAGWDETPAMLYRVHEIDDALQGDPEALAFAKFAEVVHEGKALVIIPMPLGDPREELPGIAFGFKMILEVELEMPLNPDLPNEEDLREMVKSTFSRKLKALMLVTEAWLRTSEMEDFDELDERSFADIPGSIEIRQAIVVNNNSILFLTRERGKEPTVTHVPRDGEAALQLGGTIMKALIELHDVGKGLERKVAGL